MKATVTIKRKSSSQVTTKYGQKEKHAFLLDGGKGEFWADCFANATTEGWHEGDKIEMELAPREYQGKKYWNIVPPKAQDITLETIKRIEGKIDQILAHWKKEEPESSDFDGIPDATEPPADEIPF